MTNITLPRSVVEQALNALECSETPFHRPQYDVEVSTIATLRAALEQPKVTAPQPKPEWAKTKSTWVVDHLRHATFFDADQIGEMIDFAAASAAAAPQLPVVEQSSVVEQPQGEQAPVAWTVAGQVQNWARDFSAYRTKHYVRPVYTHPQPKRESLTDAWIESTLQDIRQDSRHTSWSRAKALVRATERAHNINHEGEEA